MEIYTSFKDGKASLVIVNVVDNHSGIVHRYVLFIQIIMYGNIVAEFNRTVKIGPYEDSITVA